jgi:peptide/nickel transport system permease protein
MRYLLKRALHGVVLLVAVSVLSFALLQLAPGDFFDEMKLDPQISAQTVAQLRGEYGLDQPLPVRYVRWLRSSLHGDFGYSFAYGTPVAPLLRVRARNTLVLAGVATLLAWLLALPLGMWNAVRAGRWDDRITTGALSLSLAIPDVLVALAALLFAARTGLLPVGGMVSSSFDELSAVGKVRDLSVHLALPVAVLAFGLVPTLARHVRSAVAETLGLPFVRAARAHGLGGARLLFRHVLPAAANPLISLFGITLATLLSMSLLVEVIMSWPGLGPFFLEAIFARDVYIVIGTVLLAALFLVVGTLAADLMLFTADPRIRRT